MEKLVPFSQCEKLNVNLSKNWQHFLLSLTKLESIYYMLINISKVLNT